MRNKQQQAYLDEKLSLIMECRRSGLSDKQWCEENGIRVSTFYNWVSRLRRKHGFDIPDSPHKLPCQKQDVVRVNIVPDSTTQPVACGESEQITNLQTSGLEPAIEVFLMDSKIQIHSHASPYLIEQTIRAIRSSL